MKLIFETFVSVFIICICALLCACLISANIDVANARDAYSTYSQQLKDSNFSTNVVQAIRDDATLRGYIINITVHDNGEGDKSGNIELAYTYSIKLLGYSSTRYIRGYIS